MDECIICTESGGGPNSVASQMSLETIQSFCVDWAKIGQYFDILNEENEERTFLEHHICQALDAFA